MGDILVSIVVYSLTAFILYVLARDIALRDRRTLRVKGVHASMWSGSFAISILVFAVVAGLRYNTGVDHLSYLEYYRHGSDVIDEVGFEFITSIFKIVGLHYFFFFAFWAALQISFIYLSCNERRDILPYIALAIMLGPYFLEWMNGIRQTVIACLFVFLISYFCSNKSVKSFVLCVVVLLLSYTIHRSSIILIPLLLLCLINKPMTKRLANVCIVIACLVIGLTPYWVSMNSAFVTQVLAFLGYDHYSLVYEEMVTQADFTEFAFGPNRLSSLFVDIIIIWYFPKVRDFFLTDKALNVFFLFFFIGVCGYNLFANTNLLFLRPVLYFQIFKLPMVAYLLYYLKCKHSIWFYLVAILEFSFAFVDVAKAGLFGIKEYNLYHFFFFQ